MTLMSIKSRMNSVPCRIRLRTNKRRVPSYDPNYAFILKSLCLESLLAHRRKVVEYLLFCVRYIRSAMRTHISIKIMVSLFVRCVSLPPQVGSHLLRYATVVFILHWATFSTSSIPINDNSTYRRLPRALPLFLFPFLLFLFAFSAYRFPAHPDNCHCTRPQCSYWYLIR